MSIQAWKNTHVHYRCEWDHHPLKSQCNSHHHHTFISNSKLLWCQILWFSSLSSLFFQATLIGIKYSEARPCKRQHWLCLTRWCMTGVYGLFISKHRSTPRPPVPDAYPDGTLKHVRHTIAACQKHSIRWELHIILSLYSSVASLNFYECNGVWN